MANQTVFLTALKDPNGQSYATPRVISVPEDSIVDVLPKTTSEKGIGKSSVVLKSGGQGKSAQVYESVSEVETMRDPSSSNIKASNKALGVSATGNAQGAGYSISKYLTEVTTATGDSADSLDLPAALQDDVKVVINNTAATLQIYPASGEKFSDVAADGSKDIAPGERKHYVCLADGVWTEAEDNTQ